MSLLEAVTELARLTGDVALQYFGGELHTEIKLDGSPVTQADRAAEKAAREWVQKNFPNDGFLGEELGDFQPQSKRRWIVDPIDGTRAFRRNVPLWGTLVAHVDHGEVLAGCAFFPALGETIAAERGEGCWWNSKRAHVSGVSSMWKAAILKTDDVLFDARQAAAWSRVIEGVELARSWGDCYGYLLVATGRAEAMLDVGLSLWDAAALKPIITEAGGMFTDWKGNSAGLPADVVATNSALGDQVRRRVAGTAND